jgi:hypothetical protein
MLSATTVDLQPTVQRQKQQHEHTYGRLDLRGSTGNLLDWSLLDWSLLGNNLLDDLLDWGLLDWGLLDWSLLGNRLLSDSTGGHRGEGLGRGHQTSKGNEGERVLHLD